jgi:hypothetical protein
MSHTQNAEQLLRQHADVQLADELDFFLRHKHEWVTTHHGEFVLIGKATFGGFYPTYDAALRAGTKMFGLIAPFLIEKVCSEETKQMP